MTTTLEAQVEVIHRRCGGWLACSSRKQGLQIGVTGRSEAEALKRYRAAASEWRHNIEAGREGRSRG